MNAIAMPTLDGVEHRYLDLGGGVTIHVADAGPTDGSPVLLVHGFPQNWWEWHQLIAPLAADGYRVLCPDLRGAGWSSAPADRYLKAEMADDLAAVCDRLGVGPVALVAHDWGGPVAGIMAIEHGDKVRKFFGMNTIAPWVTLDARAARDVWRLWYQIPMSLPVIGPRVVGDPRGRYLRMLTRWVGGGFVPAEADMALYLALMGQPGHAVAGSRWYRSAQSGEMLAWMRGRYEHARLDIPVRWLHGVDDPVIRPDMMSGVAAHASDFALETVAGVGHWIVEQAPDLVLDRLRTFLRDSD